MPKVCSVPLHLHSLLSVTTSNQVWLIARCAYNAYESVTWLSPLQNLYIGTISPFVAFKISLSIIIEGIVEICSTCLQIETPVSSILNRHIPKIPTIKIQNVKPPLLHRNALLSLMRIKNIPRNHQATPQARKRHRKHPSSVLLVRKHEM